MKKFNWDYGFEKFDDGLEPVGAAFFDVHVGLGRPQRLYPETPAELRECRAQVDTCVNNLGALAPEKHRTTGVVLVTSGRRDEYGSHSDVRLRVDRGMVFVATRRRHLGAAIDCGEDGDWAEKYLSADLLAQLADKKPSPCWPEEGTAERRKRIRRRIEDRLRKLPDDDDQLMLIASILEFKGHRTAGETRLITPRIDGEKAGSK
jgi:hypothetical protein